MLQATTRIYLRDPNRADNLVPGVVSEGMGQRIMVRYLQPVSFIPGSNTVLYYHNQHNCFTSVPCQTQRMYSSGQYPTGALVLTGEPEIAENRSAFRVDIHDRSISVLVDGKYPGEAANISCGGLAVVLDVDDYKLEQWLDITIQYDGGEHTGRMQVRSSYRDKDGRFRYGLMADPMEPGLISQLSRITQEIQNIKARRNSRLGVNNKAGGKDSDPTDLDQDAHDDGEDQEHQDNTESNGDGTKRQHQRNPWPGMAKVYIREDHNMRVLNVDTADLSRGGISFICPQYIYEGSEVLFEKPIAGGFFRVMLVIRNVMVHKKGMHRVGAQFVGAPLAPGKMPDGFENIAAA